MTQDVDPLESWGMNKGRFGQPCADGAVFLFDDEHKRDKLIPLQRALARRSECKVLT